MKRKLALLTAILMLTGCASSSGVSLNAAESVQSGELPEITPAQRSEIEKLVKSGEKEFRANGMTTELSDEEWEKVLTAFAGLQASSQYYPRDYGRNRAFIDISVNGKSHTITRLSGKETYLIIDGTSEYRYGEDFAGIFGKYCDSAGDITDESTQGTESAPDRLVGLSVQCSEPKNQQEYLKTARAIAAQWLDSLKTEQGRYHLDSYSFTDRLADNRVFHGDGYINGGREFVCYVGFDTPTKDENTAFYANGTYDTFYHYYFGPGVLARFRWENGVCTLIDYDEAYAMLTSDRLKDGLYGIGGSDMKYKTFYDFMNDRGNVRDWLEKGRASFCTYTVSHNVMMLSNGDIVYMDVGNSDVPSYDGDYATTDMHQYFLNRNSKRDGNYSSPVDYIDGEGAVVMTYREGFQMVFDDYNHDGNPDYAIRISTDGKGSTYDVRCMDINGKPFEDKGEIYIYGESDESIRLQISDSGALLVPSDDGNGGIIYTERNLFSDKSNASHPQISDSSDDSYRMYSQRFYMPSSLRCYTSDDSEVVCYFWNNTSAPVNVGGDYEIQRKNGENWETAATGNIPESTVNGNSHCELAFDISGINSDEMSVYRIKTTANGTAVYGGFFYGTSSQASLEITANNYPSSTDSIKFEVNNIGMSEVFPDASLYRGQEKLCDVNICKLNSGTSTTAEITSADIGGEFTAGEYTLKISAGSREFSGSCKVVEVPQERLYHFADIVPAKRQGSDIVLSLTNNIWDEQPVTINSIGGVTIMNDSHSTALYSSDSVSGAELAFGETTSVVLKDISSILKDYESVFDEIKSNGEYADILDIEDSDISSMTFDEFAAEVLGVGVPKKGDLCRVYVTFNDPESSGEYVYFEMP